MRVVDASILCGVLTHESVALDAVEAAAKADPSDDPFHCPTIVEAETLSALRGMERGGLLTRAAANHAAAALDEVRMILYAFGAYRERAWALRHNLSIYDASYVALAEMLEESVLLTADAGLAKVASDAVGAARVQLVA
ncbi:type II toxin-antitoxin system VapC family toxin [Baekduia sp. Peel2402]|uniref:type II toxin-antitoxin system VapC family toxin n=1 Tax=Baekduia sp. Peel2402 TaxID=3458296 RepID=UPI00403E80F1